MDKMDDLMARTMVENLSIGINPLTGRILSPSDCCANEVVQEALKTVLEHCSLELMPLCLHGKEKKKKLRNWNAKSIVSLCTRMQAKPGLGKKMTYCVTSISEERKASGKLPRY